jgi:hypothetical protein
MSAIHFHLEAADDPSKVWLRTTVNPNPERKPAMLIGRAELSNVLLMMLDAAQVPDTGSAVTRR